MAKAGMTVARLNFSHGDHSNHSASMRNIRKASKTAGKNIAVMQDLQGPRIRLGLFKDGKVELKAGRKFTITTRKVTGTDKQVSTGYKAFPKDVKAKHPILINDGLVRLEVIRVKGADVECRVIIGGELSDRKGMNLPHSSVSAPPLTRKDMSDLKFGVKLGVDYVALSFVKSADEINKARKLLRKHGSPAHIIAKIERQEAIENLDEICMASDGILVARGDLGVEMPLEDVPFLQKHIINTAHSHLKPVITATQMLESLTHNTRPTRAEASDVANAVLDGTDALMLSAETSIGRSPTNAVRTMAKIALRAEEELVDTYKPTLKDSSNNSLAVALAAADMATQLKARAVLAFTEGGYTARMLSLARTKVPIIAATPNMGVVRRNMLYWNVSSLKVSEMRNIDQMIDRTVQMAVKAKHLKKGDRVVITAGVPLAISGSTNLIKLHTVP